MTDEALWWFEKANFWPNTYLLQKHTHRTHKLSAITQSTTQFNVLLSLIISTILLQLPFV